MKMYLIVDARLGIISGRLSHWLQLQLITRKNGTPHAFSHASKKVAVRLLMTVQTSLRVGEAITSPLQTGICLGVDVLSASFEVHPVRASILKVFPSHIVSILARNLIR